MYSTVIFAVTPCILMLSNLLFYPTDAQLYCSKIMPKFTLKCSYMFRFNNHHQGAAIRALLQQICRHNLAYFYFLQVNLWLTFLTLPLSFI